MSPLTWAFILLIGAFLLLVVEMFVPSHGIIGVLAAVCVAGAVIAGFYQGAAWGVLMLAISAVSVPLAIWAVFSYWPQTAIGQRILIKLPESPEEVLPESYRDNRRLIGKIGVSKTKMLLSGAIQINGKLYDAVSEDLPIEPEQEVQVVAIKMNRIIVRALDPNRPKEGVLPPVVASSALAAAFQQEPSSMGSPSSPDDLLARSAASFGLDDLPELTQDLPAEPRKRGDSPH